MELGKPTLEQSQENGLVPTSLQESLESTGSKRPRRRRWPWLLGFCVIVAGAYALLIYMGQAEKIEEWKTRLTQMGVAAYERLPRSGQGTVLQHGTDRAPSVRKPKPMTLLRIFREPSILRSRLFHWQNEIESDAAKTWRCGYDPCRIWL